MPVFFSLVSFHPGIACLTLSLSLSTGMPSLSLQVACLCPGLQARWLDQREITASQGQSDKPRISSLRHSHLRNGVLFLSLLCSAGLMSVRLQPREEIPPGDKSKDIKAAFFV